MKLITEITHEVKTSISEEATGKKSVFIEGIFAQAEIQNRNGRVYRKNILESAVNDFIPMINSKRAMGELGHPPNPQINLDKVSHLITDLRFEGNDVYGKAKILDTPNGKIAKNLIEEGVQLGVSTRGLGSLKSGSNGIMEVQNDFRLATVDIVADPSANDAFVQGIYEAAEWLYVEGKGYVLSQTRNELENAVRATRYDKNAREQMFFEAFSKFLRQIK